MSFLLLHVFHTRASEAGLPGSRFQEPLIWWVLTLSLMFPFISWHSWSWG